MFVEYFKEEILKRGFLPQSIPDFLKYFKQKILKASYDCILETKNVAAGKDFEKELNVTIAYQVRNFFKSNIQVDLLSYYDALVKVYRTVLYSYVEKELFKLKDEDMFYVISSVEDDILVIASSQLFTIISTNPYISKDKFQDWLYNEKESIKDFILKSLKSAYSETYINW